MPNSKATVSGDFSNLISGAENAAKSVANLGLKLSGISVAGKGIDIATHAVGGLVTGLGKIGLAASGIEAVGKSAAAMGMGLVKGNAALEMTTISFKTLLGSTSAAQDMIKQLTTFAANTPFNLTGLESSTQNLLAFGFGAKEIIPLMTSMGDAISALGGTQANLDSLVHVMGQMRQEAHINAGDIMQMTNLGIPALQMLADHYKVTTGQMQEMVSKGLVPGQDAIKIFSTGMEKQYGGMMAAQSATFSGMVSNLQDWATATTVILTKPFFEPAKKALKAFLDYTGSPAGQRAVQVLAGHIQEGVDVAVRAFDKIYKYVDTTLLPILDKLWGYFDTHILPKIKEVAGAFQEKLAGGIQLATDKFKDALPGLESFYKKIEPIVGKALELYRALSPLSIAFDVLKGILTGGLQGGFIALENHIAGVGRVFGVDLTPQLLIFNQWVTQTAIPTLQSWASTFLNDWWPKIQTAVGFVIQKVGDFATFITTQVWPPVKAFLDWLAGIGMGLFNSVATTLDTIVIPAVGRFFHYIAEVLWPKLRDEVFPWIDQNVRPKLEQAFKIIDEKIIPFMGNMVDTVLNHMIPALVAWWGVLFTLINPFLSTLGDIITKDVLPALDLLFGSAKDNKKGIDGMIDGFKNFMGIVGGIVNGFHLIWEAMGGWLVETTINNIGKIITMLGLMGDTIDALGKKDYARAALDMVKVLNIWNGTQVISGSPGSAQGGQTAGDIRLAQYILEHPNYNPAAAGNSHAAGTRSAPGGLSLVGERGMELIQFAGKLMLATRPMLLNLPKGAQVFNNRDTMAMLPSPASAQQISTMYQTSNANRSWDYSTQNSHNVSTTNQYFYGQQQGGQMPFGQQMRWYGAK